MLPLGSKSTSPSKGRPSLLYGELSCIFTQRAFNRFAVILITCGLLPAAVRRCLPLPQLATGGCALSQHFERDFPTTLKELRNAHSGGSEEEAADSSHSILRNAHSGGSEEETVDSSHSIPRNAHSGGSEEEAADSSHSIPRQSYLESME